MSIRIKLIIAYFLMIIISMTMLVFGMVRVTADFFKNVSESTIGDRSVDEVAHGVLNLLVDFEYMSRYEQALFLDEVYLEDFEEKINDMNMALYVEHEGELIYKSSFLDDVPFSDFYHQLDFERGDNGEFNKASNSPFKVSEYDYSDGTVFVIRHPVNEDSPEEGYLYVVSKKADMDNIGEKIFGRFFRDILVMMGVLLIVMTGIVTQLVIKPLKVLEDSTLKIRQGQLDFSVRSKKSDEIGQVMNAFDTMRAELKRSIEQQVQYEENRKELITSISHDLKTPITSIKGYVEGIRDGVANDEEKMNQYLDVIYQKSNALDQLIDDLFLFSKLDLNRVPFNFSQIDAKDFFDDCYQELRIDLNKAGFELTHEQSIDKGTLLSLDAQQFRRIMVNVVGNAVKYSLDNKAVILRTYLNNDNVHIEVQDFGKGIEQAELEQIFEKFYRCDPARNADVGGSGLGLAITKQIVEMHGGSIWADSEIGEGTTIHILLERVNGV